MSVTTDRSAMPAHCLAAAGQAARAVPLAGGRAGLAVAVLYVGAFVALDRISGADALSDVGFALWNPAPACSLALLLIGGLRFAPLLLAAGIVADIANAGFAGGVWPALAADAVIAGGYALIAVVLRRFAGGRLAFQDVRNLGTSLGILGAGILAIGGALTVAATLVPGASAPSLTGVRHFWIGDATGVVGLLPVLLTAPRALRRWRQVSVRARIGDLAGYGCGLAAALWVVFSLAGAGQFQFCYLLLPPVMWIAVRHGLPWCAVAVLTEQVALVAVVTHLGYPAAYFSTFQTLLLAIAVTGLVLGAVVSDHRRAELRLREHQLELGRLSRLATAGALGTAIIHEMSQPLGAIAACAHVCRGALRAGSERGDLLREATATIEAEAARAGAIIGRLRDFLSHGGLAIGRFDIAETARRAAANLASEAASRGVALQVSAQPAWCTADSVQVELVLVNLVRNAIEAASGTGARRGRVQIVVRRDAGRVEVAVADNGEGVAQHVAARLFEPFATGKARGIGFGLVLSRQIVTAHGGELWCDRSGPDGARFVFRLPEGGPDGDAH